MNHQRASLLLVTLSLATFGLVGCSQSSPTEPTVSDFSRDSGASAASFADASASYDGDSSLVVDDSSARHGADDPADHDANDDKGGSSGGGGNSGSGNSGGGNGGGGNGGGGNNGGGNGGGTTAPQGGREFEAAVVSVAGNRLTLAGGTVVQVNGQTVWSRRGDLLTLQAVDNAVRRGQPVRAEGRGRRQGSVIVANSIKVEVDN